MFKHKATNILKGTPTLSSYLSMKKKGKILNKLSANFPNEFLAVKAHMYKPLVYICTYLTNIRAFIIYLRFSFNIWGFISPKSLIKSFYFLRTTGKKHARKFFLLFFLFSRFFFFCFFFFFCSNVFKFKSLVCCLVCWLDG